ncbi:carboxymuconolactone decarboxylase family protein [Nocardia harenae]|uniref:carboxymuconolactone decarboxylase family protein n=1 Tax=Nocardia harenae TaxID=358707 RepID=UPI00082B657F|nr:carboxymuconolactone decarboxylase family protein [Nocardia harenae]
MNRARAFLTTAVAALVVTGTAACTSAKETTVPPSPTDPSAVAPVLAHYDRAVLDQVWARPDLSPRDRSLITVAALIARNQTAPLGAQLERALDHGLSPAEISETITHLAFYAGRGNADGAVAVTAPIFQRRGVTAAELPPVTPENPLPLDLDADDARAAGVERDYGAVGAGVGQYTTDVLFRDLWLRPGLAPRDRSLVTVAALIATGQTAQITYHLGRALDNGLTAAQAAETLTHLAFYTGWPPVFSALPVVRDVLANR